MISAVILTKNESENIEGCIKSIDFCDEIIIVDDGSTDDTIDKAEKYGAKVYKRPLNDNFSEQLNFGMSKTKGDWILFVDPDERMSPELTEEILQFIQDDTNRSALKFRRIDYMWGRWIKRGEVGAFRDIRLLRKGKGKWVRRVHQYISFKGRSFKAVNPILHYPHKNLHRFIANINKWSTIHAIANREEGKKSTLFKIIFYPPIHFVRNYIIRLGFLDGMQGFVLALMMALHSYLSWSKLWMLQKGFTKI